MPVSHRARTRAGAIAAVIAWILLAAPSASAQTFTNPIGPGSDPWVFRWQGYYYLCLSAGGGITVAKAAKLEDIARSPRVTVWKAPASGAWSKELWAPEMHYLQGRWWAYVAADDGSNANHRIYALSCGEQDPQAPCTMKGKIAAPTDRWAIDATVLSAGGKDYLVWSGWADTQNVRQNLYIAPMANPWTLAGDRVMLSTPDHPWEKLGGNPSINEGPEALYHDGQTFLVYSASGSWSDYYCLGQLRLGGKNPLDSAAWSKTPKPVFSPTDQVFGPGHCSFVKSADGGEDWIVYHAAVASGAGWNRNLRIQQFGWQKDGNPWFGTPIPEGVPIPVPGSGPLALGGGRGALPSPDAAGSLPRYPVPLWASPAGLRDGLGRIFGNPRIP